MTIQAPLNPIFIVGAPRSGTTLLSAMLSSHPRIAIAPETHFISHDYRTQANVDLQQDRVLDSVWAHFVGGQWFGHLNLDAGPVYDEIQSLPRRTFATVFSTILSAYAVSVNKPRWGEKTPGHYLHVETILDWFPNAQILVSIRDPRAVCASLTQVPWGNRYVTYHARRWLDAAAMLQRYRHDSRVHAVKYEDLVQSPVDEMQTICDFLGEDFSAEMIDRRTCSLETGGDRWQNNHLTSAIARPLTTANIDRWLSTLSPLQISKVEYMTRDTMKHFGYEPLSKCRRMPMLLHTRCESLVSRIHLGIRRHIQLRTRRLTQPHAS